MGAGKYVGVGAFACLFAAGAWASHFSGPLRGRIVSLMNGYPQTGDIIEVVSIHSGNVIKLCVTHGVAAEFANGEIVDCYRDPNPLHRVDGLWSGAVHKVEFEQV